MTHYSRFFHSCESNNLHHGLTVPEYSLSKPHNSIKLRVSAVVRFVSGAAAFRRAVALAAK